MSVEEHALWLTHVILTSIGFLALITGAICSVMWCFYKLLHHAKFMEYWIDFIWNYNQFHEWLKEKRRERR